jgi:hypothetical protein
MLKQHPKLNEMRNRIHKFTKEIEERYHLNWVGLLDEVNIAEVHKKYDDIFTLDNIKWIKNLSPNNSKGEKLLKRLLSILITTYLEKQTKELIDKRLNVEATSSFEFNGTTITYRSSGPKMANEPDRNKRIEMYNEVVKLKQKHITPLREEFIKVIFEKVHELGFKNYVELCSFLQERDFYKFAETMEKFLQRTESVYVKYLEMSLKKELGIKLKDAHSTDILLLRRATQYDKYFPKENMLKAFKNTMLAIGFNIDKMKNIQLDTEARQKKIPRACVTAVDPPNDVRLTVYPMGGQDDYVAILHEGGHAVHFAHDRRNLEMEYKYLGDRGFTEGVAYLFQHLTLNTGWLQKHVGMEKDDEYLKFAYFHRLMAIRRLAINALYQFKLFEDENLEGKPELYEKMIIGCQKIEISPASYLDMDMDFYSAGYVRAMLFESQLRAYLEENIGKDWWDNKETSYFLKQHYQHGRKFSAEEVLKSINFGELSTKYFENELYTVLTD